VTDDEMLAAVKDILEDNARLLGEEQEVFLRRWRGAWRVQSRVDGRWARFAFKEYRTVGSLYWAAGVAHDRAKAIAAERETA
jgi:hypothetical protein